MDRVAEVDVDEVDGWAVGHPYELVGLGVGNSGEDRHSGNEVGVVRIQALVDRGLSLDQDPVQEEVRGSSWVGDSENASTKLLSFLEIFEVST